jgi:CMP-N-acetylneuraminic acid synthetase
MIAGKRVLAVIPARGGSKGIPLKNIRKIGGVPMVVLAGKIAGLVEEIDRAIVSTDSEEIARVAEESGLAAPFRRPLHLSGDVVSDVPVLQHALAEMERIDGLRYDIVVMLQPTSPMRTLEHVTKTIRRLVEDNLDVVWTVSESDSKSHPLKQLVIIDGMLDYYDSEGAKIIARQQLTPVYHRNGLAYAIQRDFLTSENGSLKGPRTGAEITDGIFISIDTEWDIELTEFAIFRVISGAS